MKRIALASLILSLLAARAAADELRLKDGTKLVGTIVGYEDNSFKVLTNYGYALVRKDMVAAILMPEPKKEAAAEKKNERKPASPPAAAQATTPAAPAAKADSAPPVKADAPPPAAPAAQLAASNATAATASTAAAPARRPGAPPAPETVREEVAGNTYVNLTYGFRMYKPPNWHVIEGARKMLPSAVVAMGTSDEATLLVVGHEPLHGSLDAVANSTEQQLREMYENYRPLGEQKVTISGLPGLERRFRGMVGEHDWSGRVVWLARGNEVYTLMGLTYADSDLIQVEENVIARTINSLEFH
jgi:hypothetical protein